VDLKLTLVTPETKQLLTQILHHSQYLWSITQCDCSSQSFSTYLFWHHNSPISLGTQKNSCTLI